MSAEPWWAGMPAVVEPIACGEEVHLLTWAGGVLHAEDHGEPLGGLHDESHRATAGVDPTSCGTVIDAWRSHRDDSRALAVGPLDALDALRVDPEELDKLLSLRPGSDRPGSDRPGSDRPGGWAGPGRIGRWPSGSGYAGFVAGGPVAYSVIAPIAFGGTGWSAPWRLARPTRAFRPRRAARLGPVGGIAAPGRRRRPADFVAAGSTAGPAAGGAATRAWQSHLELLLLLGLSRPLVDRFLLEVCVNLTGDGDGDGDGDGGDGDGDGDGGETGRGTGSAPKVPSKVEAALLARALHALGGWAAPLSRDRLASAGCTAIRATPEDGSLLSVAPDGKDRLLARVAPGWLPGIWGRQLALVDGYLTTEVLEVADDRAWVRALRPRDGALRLTPRTVEVCRRPGTDSWTVASR